MSNLHRDTVDRIIRNASKLGHFTQTAAWALELLGVQSHSLCCWCAEKQGHDHVFRVPKGGECSRCSYTGRDTLVCVPEQGEYITWNLNSFSGASE